MTGTNLALAFIVGSEIICCRCTEGGYCTMHPTSGITRGAVPVTLIYEVVLKEEYTMKPNEKKPEKVFRIINRITGAPVGSYSRAYCDEYDFNSPEEARSANCHGMFQDKEEYAIAEYCVTYKLINPDVDG